MCSNLPPLPLTLPPPPSHTHTQGSSPKGQKFDSEWRTKYVRTLIGGLSATRLSKSICAQFRGKVTSSHETFLTAIKQLEMRHSGRLKETQDQRNTIRKVCGCVCVCLCVCVCVLWYVCGVCVCTVVWAGSCRSIPDANLIRTLLSVM